MQEGRRIMEKTIRIDRLPTRTWNRLQVNDAAIQWVETKTEALPAIAVNGKECPEVLRLSFSDNGVEYAQKAASITAKKGSTVTVIEDCRAEKPLAVALELTIEEDACIRLVQLLNPDQGAVLRHEVRTSCGKNARFSLVSVLVGDGDIYEDTNVQLTGEGSRFEADLGYLARKKQTIDVNIAADHWGKKTRTEIRTNGALMDCAKKVFRGTIDFKNGSSDSVGSENETVLMLGEDVVNKTVPLILCAEENVEGTHGATIGELDDATLFYFESRGISKERAEAIMARAAIERLMRVSGDEAFADRVSEVLRAELPEEEDGE